MDPNTQIPPLPETPAAPASPPPVPAPVAPAPQVIGVQPQVVLDDLTKEKPVAGQFGVSTSVIHSIRWALVVLLILVLLLAVYMLIQSGQLSEWWRQFVAEPIRKLSQP